MQRSTAQRHRMNRVMNFARAQLANKLDLDQLASVACLSKYHFTRVFDAHFNETPMEFLNRVRLEHALRHLAFTADRKITDIALDSGFSSSQSFSRSFRKQFGISPRAFKAHNQWSLRKFEALHPFANELYVPRPQRTAPQCRFDQVRIETQRTRRIAYIRHIGPFGDVKDSITETFSKVQWWANRQGILRQGSTYIGVCAGSCSITPARKCVYDAGILLEHDLPEDDFVSVRTIPTGRYAVLPVECKPPELNGKWAWLKSKWLPGSGQVIGSHPSFEMFTPPLGLPVRAEFGARLCLSLGTPVRPLR
ncbi:MAG: AraC family transcriptional regulator [Alphaproteobacteria bacterium]|nr:AraC family transcriptional regulator [Alphaproteobacteria bacterium]